MDSTYLEIPFVVIIVWFAQLQQLYDTWNVPYSDFF